MKRLASKLYNPYGKKVTVRVTWYNDGSSAYVEPKVIDTWEFESCTNFGKGPLTQVFGFNGLKLGPVETYGYMVAKHLHTTAETVPDIMIILYDSNSSIGEFGTNWDSIKKELYAEMAAFRKGKND